MQSQTGRSVDRVFAALADPTRRAILAALARGERGATDLVAAGPRRISQPAVSRHLRVLREAGLIRKRVHGRTHWCLLRPEGFGPAAAWMDRYRAFWEGQLDALDQYLSSAGGSTAKGDGATHRRKPRRTRR